MHLASAKGREVIVWRLEDAAATGVTVSEACCCVLPWYDVLLNCVPVLIYSVMLHRAPVGDVPRGVVQERTENDAACDIVLVSYAYDTNTILRRHEISAYYCCTSRHEQQTTLLELHMDGNSVELLLLAESLL